MIKAILFTIVLTTGVLIDTSAQHTFTAVYNLLQTQCSGSGCHSGPGAVSFDVSGSPTDVYNSIVNVNSENQAALAKGDKLVTPGYPSRSFLLRKMAYGLSHDLEIESQEGEAMPSDSVKLADENIEIVRQWILFGAPETGQVVNEQTIRNYYNGQGLTKIIPLTPPDPTDGIQIHEGPYFLNPQPDEREFLRKVELNLPDTMEVYKMEMRMHSFSHHFILYKYKPNGSQNVKAGVRILNGILDQFDMFTNANTIATWQYDRVVELPSGTAYFWEPNTVLDMNFHVPNYDADSILAAEVYVNFYIRPRQPQTVQMYASLASYGGFNPFALNINNDGKDTTFTIEQYQPGSNEIWNFWVMQAHSHSRGKDFDIYMRNPDGTKGAQVYEGFYNEDYTFNQGFYSYTHPAVKIFEPMLPVEMKNGLIHEAVYNNNTSTPIGFGLTTKDEMFITYYQYTRQPVLTGIKENGAEGHDIRIYPNPFQNNFSISYFLDESANVKMELFDAIGKKAMDLLQEHQPAGNYWKTFDTESKRGLLPGMYILKLTVNDLSVSRKVIQTK